MKQVAESTQGEVLTGIIALVILLGCLSLVAVVTLKAFRAFIRSRGMEQLFENGVVMTEEGIEFLRFVFAGRSKASYGDIELVWFVPFPKNLLAGSSFDRRRWVATRAPRGPFRGTVIIRLKQQNFSKYLRVQPDNPAGFAEELKKRIEQYRASHGCDINL